MKIFALYTTVTLTKKPEWLDAFLKKYQPRGLHVTLVQPRFVKEENVVELKKTISQFFLRCTIGPLDVVFDKPVYNENQSGAIMVCASHAEILIKLQKDICSTLSGYCDYVELIREGYEKDFKPHITIGDDIPEEQYKESLSFLKEGCLCEGVIDNVVLAVVNDMSNEEASNPANKTILSLKQSSS